MNEKQQQLTFEKGITNIPSDTICSDNALQDATNLTYRDGEHHIIQKPVSLQNTQNMKLLFVHKLPNGNENWIYEEYSSFDSKYHLNYNNATITGSGHSSEVAPSNVTAIGKTLILNNGGNISYFLWKGSTDVYNDGYKYLSGVIPCPDIQFELDGPGTAVKERTDYNMSIVQIQQERISVVDQDAYNDLVIGLYSKCLNKIAEDKKFAKPFLVRYAVEMYDGTYTAISSPIMCYAGVQSNHYAAWVDSTPDKFELGVYPFGLRFKPYYDLSDYSDIVKKVVVFATDGIDLYNLTSDQHPQRTTEGAPASGNVVDYVSLGYYDNIPLPTASSDFIPYLTLTQAGDDVRKGLVSEGLFYKIAELGLKFQRTTFMGIGNYMIQKPLVNLTTNERLPMDYFTNAEKGGKCITSYNNRLLLANVNRGFFTGFKSFSVWHGQGGDTSYTYHIYYYIKTDEGEKIVSSDITTKEFIGHYIYYPDPRAFKAVIFKDATYIGTLTLTEHASLNGAYYYSGLPINCADINGKFDNGTLPTVINPPTYPIQENNSPEQLTGHIYVSDANNPFVFGASGDITVGNGSIIGIAPITQALSQGQFGQYPLIAFSTDGIWALSMDATGVFTNITPMSREVALTTNPAITQTDGAIFFVSKKGLMVVVGNEVRCVSEQLSGRSSDDFEAFFANSVIAYDYRDSLLWIFKKTVASANALIYAIKSGTFAWCNQFANKGVYNVVNKYPDYLIQTTSDSNQLYSLTDRPNINADSSPYTATLKTRPMKLENALALKSILEARHIYDFHTPGDNEQSPTIAFEVYASNNLKTWVQLTSLRGTPWKYYRFEYTFNNLKANDTFAGTVLITQERRTNKLR